MEKEESKSIGLTDTGTLTPLEVGPGRSKSQCSSLPNSDPIEAVSLVLWYWLDGPAAVAVLREDLADTVTRDTDGLAGASITPSDLAALNGLAVVIELETVNGEVLSFWSFAGDLTSLAC